MGQYLDLLESVLKENPLTPAEHGELMAGAPELPPDAHQPPAPEKQPSARQRHMIGVASGTSRKWASAGQDKDGNHVYNRVGKGHFITVRPHPETGKDTFYLNLNDGGHNNGQGPKGIAHGSFSHAAQTSKLSP